MCDEAAKWIELVAHWDHIAEHLLGAFLAALKNTCTTRQWRQRCGECAPCLWDAGAYDCRQTLRRIRHTAIGKLAASAGVPHTAQMPHKETNIEAESIDTTRYLKELANEVLRDDATSSRLRQAAEDIVAAAEKASDIVANWFSRRQQQCNSAEVAGANSGGDSDMLKIDAHVAGCSAATGSAERVSIRPPPTPTDGCPFCDSFQLAEGQSPHAITAHMCMAHCQLYYRHYIAPTVRLERLGANARLKHSAVKPPVRERLSAPEPETKFKRPADDKRHGHRQKKRKNRRR